MKNSNAAGATGLLSAVREKFGSKISVVFLNNWETTNRQKLSEQKCEIIFILKIYQNMLAL